MNENNEVAEEVKEPTGMALSSALSQDEEMLSGEHTIILTIRDHKAPEVTMTGFWDGRLLNAAMKSIERKYDDVRKHAAIWAMKQAQEQK